jgi:hypothetical protein
MQQRLVSSIFSKYTVYALNDFNNTCFVTLPSSLAYKMRLLYATICAIITAICNGIVQLLTLVHMSMM